MNNDAIRQFVRRELRAVTLGVATAIGFGGGLPAAIANPVGGSVVSGRGSITSPNATTTLINQQSTQLTLNWSSFDVASGQTVRFVQPSSSSVALNNILSQSPSQIFGEIDANGRVVLINPNGILFGRTAQLNVGSLVASSLELKQYDPATGRLSFESLSGHPGVIDNEGTITAAPGGSVALLGGTVLNNGLVVADYGTVAMGAGQAATLDFYGGGLLRLQVSGDVKTNSSGAKAAVRNSGTIQADGGQVLLTASAAQGVFASAVDNSGVIRAARIRNVGGVIQLLGTDGAATDSGTLDASGADAASAGGTVTVTGKSASLASTAKVDVSGAAGGGTANIGGGLHGADSSVPNASSTSVASGASIDADATHQGNGGTIAVWSDGTTTAQGSFLASGGPAGGNGGMIETSGHVLNATGATVRAGATAGKAGEWLLDPENVLIDHASGSGTIAGGGNGAHTTVHDGDINAALLGTGTGDGTDVTIETPAGGSSTDGTITFDSGVVITNGDTAAHTLTLDAGTSIDLTNATTAPSITSGTGGLDLTLTANGGGVTLDGTINVNALTVSATGGITQSAGTITASGNLSETAGGTISQDAGAVLQLSGTAGTNTATFTVTGSTHDVSLGGANDFNDEATTITATGAGAAVGNVWVVDTNATFVPLTLPASIASLVLSDANAPITLGAETLTGVGSGNNLAGGTTTLDITAGGEIAQGGALSVTGTTSVNAGSGNDIDLSTGTNTFSGNVAFTGVNVTLASSGALSSSGTAKGNLSETAGGTISEGSAGIQLTGTAGANTATFTVTGATHDVDLGSTANDFNDDATTIGKSGTGAAVGNVRVVDTDATFVPLTLPASIASLVLSDANAPITLGAETLTGVGSGNNLAGGTTTLDVTAGGDITQSGALSVTGTTSLDAGAGNDIDLSTATNAFSGNVGFTADNVTLTSGGALSSSGTAKGNLSETAGGTISEGAAGIQLTGTAAANTATFTVTGAAHDVNLGNGANDFNDDATTIAANGGGSVANVSVADIYTTFAPLTLPTSITSLVLSDTHAPITLPAETLTGVGSGNNLAGGTTTLDVTAGGEITQGGALSVTGTTSLDAGAGNAITLSNSSNIFIDSVTLTGGAVTLANSTNTTLAGTNSAASLTLDAGGAVTFGTTSSDSTTVTGTGALIIRGVGGSGAANGTVSQTGKLAVGGTSSIDAGANDITLTNSSNSFTGAVTLTGGAVTLANSSATTLAGTNSASSLTLDARGTVAFGSTGSDSTTITGTGTLIIQGVAGSGAAGGAVSQLGTLAVGGTSSINAGTHDITLANSGNSFTGALTLTGGAVTLANSIATTLTGTNSASSLTLDAGSSVAFGSTGSDSTTVTGTGVLVIQGVGGSGAAGGAVSQLGTLAVGGTSKIDAGANDITLANSGNSFAGAVTLTGGAVTLANSDATTLAGTNSVGSLTLDAGGAVAFGNTISDSTTITGTGALVVQGVNGSGTSSGAVSQVGTLVVGGTTSIDAGTNDITLANSGNSFAGAVTLTGGAVTLANLDATTLAGTNSASSLTLDAGGAVAFGNTIGDSTTITGTGALVVQGVNGSGTSGGAVSQVGTLAVGGTSSIDAGSNAITLDNSSNSFGGNVGFVGGTVTLVSSGALSSSGTASGDLSETAGGTISEGSGGIQLTGITGTNTAKFTVTAAGSDVVLSSAANNFNGESTLIQTSGAGTVDNVSVTDTNATFVPLTLPSSTLTSLTLVDTNAAIAVPGVTLTGTGTVLDVTAGGAITQSAALTLTDGAAMLNTTGGAGDITLTSLTNSFGGGITLDGNNVTLANTTGTTIAGTSTAGSLTLDAGGAVAFGSTTGDSTTVTNDLIVQGLNGSGTSSGAVSQVGTLAVGGTSSIDAGTNAITLSNAGNSFTGPLTLSGGAVTLANSIATTLGGVNSAGSLTLDAGGAVAFGSTSTDSTTVTGTGALVIQGVNGSGAAGGAVSQAGTLAVGGTTSIDADTHDITLANSGNSLTGAVTLTGGAVTLANSVDTTLAGSNSTSSLTIDAGGAVAFGSTSSDSTTVTGTGALVIQGVNGSGAAGGAVSQAGTLNVGGISSIDAGGNSIALANSSNSFGGNVAFTGGAVTLASSGALSSSGIASGNLSETAGGTISEGPAGIQLTGVAGTNTATFTVTAAGSDVDLSSTANDFNGESTTIQTSGSGTVDNVSVTDSNASFVPLTLPSSTLTSLTLVDPNAALVVPAATLTGAGTALDVTAGGAITQSGALVLTSGGAVLDADGGADDITLASTGNSFNGGITLDGNNVTLANAAGTTIAGTSTAGSLTLDAGGALVFGTTGADSTTVTNGLVVQGLNGSGAAGGTVTQVGSLSVGGTSSITAGTHDITLADSSNSFTGALTLTGAAVTLANSVDTTLGGTSSAGSLTLDAEGAVTFGSTGSDSTTVTGTGALIVQGVNGSGAAGGTVSQAGKLVVGGTSSIDAGTHDITLANAGNSLAGAVTLTGGAVTLANADATTLAGTNSTSSLTLDAGGTVTFGSTGSDSTTVTGTGALIVQGVNGSGAAGGSVTQVGTLAVVGTSNIDAGTHDITLANSGNAFAGAVTLIGGAVTLANSDATTLGGANSASSLTLDAGGPVTFGSASTDSTTVTNGLIVQGVSGSGAAGGAVSQVGKLAIGTTTSIDAGSHAITLGNSSNSFGGNVAFTGGAVTLASAGALSSSGTATGDLSETAAGTIGEGTAGIQLGGTAGANTATFTVTGAAQDVNLGNAANDFNGDATTLAASAGGSAGNVSVADTYTTFVPLTLPGTLTSLVLSDPNAPIALHAGTLTGVGGGENLAGGKTTLDVTAGGAITQTGALSVNGTTALDANSGASDITLGAANTFGGNVGFGARNVTLTTGTGDLSSSGTAGGTLSETAAGSITQGGVLSVTGASTLTADGGAGDIALGQANTFGGNVAFDAHNVALTTGTGDLSSSGTAGGTLSETAAGSITQGGVLNVTGVSTLTAGGGAADITLGQANIFGGNVSFDAHNVTLTTGTGGLSSSGLAGGTLSETAAGAITQGGALSIAGQSTLTANGGAGDITLANSANAFTGPITLGGGTVTLANTDATTLAGSDTATDLTLDAGGAVTFGAASTDHTTVANDLVVQGLTGSGTAAGGAVGEAGTLSVGGTTSIDAGGNAIKLDQANAFGGEVNFTGGNVALTAGAGSLTTSGTATGTLTAIAKGASSDLDIGTLSAGGNVLLIAGDSILGTSSQSTVTANNVEVRYGLENSNGELGSGSADRQVGFQAASGSSRVQLTIWLPAPGTQFEDKDLRQTASDLSITRHPFVAGEQGVLYSAPFGVSPGQVAGTLATIQSTLQGTSTQSAGVAQGAATQGTQSVLYIDWGSYNPNVSLFGTLNPAVCLPADQRDDSVGSGSGCAAASASVLRTPTPVRVAMVPTREGWKAMQLFYLAQ